MAENFVALDIEATPPSSPNMSESASPHTSLTRASRSQPSSQRQRSASQNARNAVTYWLSHDTLERGKVTDEEISRSSKRVATFYRHQNQLVDAYFQLDTVDDERADDADEVAAEGKRVKIAVYGSFAVNVCLFVIKVYAAVASGSLAVIASALDSFLDLLSGSIIFVTNYLIKRKNPYLYPAGKERLEPLGIIIFAACMFVFTLQLIIQSIQVLLSGHADIDITIPTLVIIAITVVAKAGLYLYCRTITSSASAQALAQDHRNDVISNTVGAATALVGFYYLWWFDALGAIIIGGYIMTNWFRTGYGHVVNLTGRSAPPEFIKQITYVCLKHDERIKQIDTVRAFHLGLGYLVEVDIILPEEMTLKDAHDIGQTLQDKLEKISPIERAFVHLDYEADHVPEHRIGSQPVQLFETEE